MGQAIRSHPTRGPSPHQARRDDAAVWILEGDTLANQGKMVEAENAFRQALGRNQESPDALRGLGRSLASQGRLEEALDAYSEAAQLDPNNAMDVSNGAAILQRLGHPSEGAELLLAVVSAKPGFVEARYNLALCLRDLGRLRDAQRHLTAVLAIRPDMINAEFELALIRLMEGDFENGWKGYECRRRHPGCDISKRSLPGPLWDGVPNPDLTVVIAEEQGYGDTFQFSRYLPLVAERVGQLIFECRPATRRLFENFPGVDELVVRDSDLPAYDAQAPLLSLPHLLGTTLDTIPGQSPYLQPMGTDPMAPARGSDSQALRKGEALRVGLVWAGSPTHPNDRNRSAPLGAFTALADIPGVALYSLQKGPARDELSDVFGDAVVDLGMTFHDFNDTARAIQNLDLILSVDTSVAHLAGAMGRPTWVLLPASPEWRWMRDRPDSPWYPSIRLFRQPTPGDWESVINAVAGELAPLTPPTS